MLKRFLDPADTTQSAVRPIIAPSETEVVAARMKSYIGAAILTFVLYWFLWLPGLIANWLFYQDAKEKEQIAGRSLPGAGLLTFMLWANVVIVGLIVLALVL